MMRGKGLLLRYLNSVRLYLTEKNYLSFVVRFGENETKTESSELCEREGSPSTYGRSTISSRQQRGIEGL